MSVASAVVFECFLVEYVPGTVMVAESKIMSFRTANRRWLSKKNELKGGFTGFLGNPFGVSLFQPLVAHSLRLSPRRKPEQWPTALFHSFFLVPVCWTQSGSIMRSSDTIFYLFYKRLWLYCQWENSWFTIWLKSIVNWSGEFWRGTLWSSLPDKSVNVSLVK